MTIDINFIKKFENNFSQNVNLSNYSWFNLGGKAEFFFKPNDTKQLIEFLIEAKKNNLETTILGAGSNTLVRDNGVKGAVIKLGSNFALPTFLARILMASQRMLRIVSAARRSYAIRVPSLTAWPLRAHAMHCLLAPEQTA